MELGPERGTNQPATGRRTPGLLGEAYLAVVGIAVTVGHNCGPSNHAISERCAYGCIGIRRSAADRLHFDSALRPNHAMSLSTNRAEIVVALAQPAEHRIVASLALSAVLRA
jgi:hypothetical protein